MGWLHPGCDSDLSEDCRNFGASNFPFKTAFKKGFKIIFFSLWRRDPVLELQFPTSLRIVLPLDLADGRQPKINVVLVQGRFENCFAKVRFKHHKRQMGGSCEPDPAAAQQKLPPSSSAPQNVGGTIVASSRPGGESAHPASKVSCMACLFDHCDLDMSLICSKHLRSLLGIWPVG